MEPMHLPLAASLKPGTKVVLMWCVPYQRSGGEGAPYFSFLCFLLIACQRDARWSPTAARDYGVEHVPS